MSRSDGGDRKRPFREEDISYQDSAVAARQTFLGPQSRTYTDRETMFERRLATERGDPMRPLLARPLAMPIKDLCRLLRLGGQQLLV